MAKIVVAMSGGVDSSVAAALLKQQGHEVIGMMLRLWSEPGKEESNRCCTPDAMALAKRVTAKLEIPFYVIDAKEVFRKTVVQYFLDGHAHGETPNPCLVCNRQIRWTFLLDHALALGADFMATGHYARIKKDANGMLNLMRGIDASKDQSYVLHIMTQEKLRRAMFPIGNFQKAEIRKMAASFGLPTASQQDSQDLCFLAGDDYRNFLARNAADLFKPGQIVMRDGQVLGEHTGLANYTIGQRKGLGVGWPEPLYVLGKNPSTNTIVVGNQGDLGTSKLMARDANWISGKAPIKTFRAQIKIRSTAKDAEANVLVYDEPGKVQVCFDAPQRGITAGQAAVFYEGEVVLGGGIIQ